MLHIPKNELVVISFIHSLIRLLSSQRSSRAHGLLDLGLQRLHLRHLERDVIQLSAPLGVQQVRPRLDLEQRRITSIRRRMKERIE